jgi:hypothetical protein
VGDSWASRFQEGSIDLGNWVDLDSLVKKYPARGEFVDVEWESGHPCAKIRNVIEAGTESLESAKLQAKGAQFTGDKVGVTETIWFAMDTHQILKIERDMTIDRKVENAGVSSFGGGSSGAPFGAGPPPGMMPGTGGGKGGAGAGDFIAPTDNRQRRGRFGRPGAGGPGGFGPPGGFPGAPGGFGPGRNGGAPAASQATFIRIHVLQTFTLEK